MAKQNESSPVRTGVAAKRLGVHPETIRRAARQGKLAGARTPGGHWRVVTTPKK